MLDIEECERARVRRDRRFDGLFFSGVRTTRIYCRPVCPVRPAKAANVMFYPSAAAAELAGFRPCLRCRPEAAPFSPAWKGTRTTVERALRLFDRLRELTGSEVDVPEADVAQLSYALAARVEFSPGDKLELLSDVSERSRLDRLCDLLENATATAQRVRGAAERAATNGRVHLE